MKLEVDGVEAELVLEALSEYGDMLIEDAHWAPDMAEENKPKAKECYGLWTVLNKQIEAQQK